MHVETTVIRPRQMAFPGAMFVHVSVVDTVSGDHFNIVGFKFVRVDSCTVPVHVVPAMGIDIAQANVDTLWKGRETSGQRTSSAVGEG